MNLARMNTKSLTPLMPLTSLTSLKALKALKALVVNHTREKTGEVIL
jgi:hypothetical protein